MLPKYGLGLIVYLPPKRSLSSSAIFSTRINKLTLTLISFKKVNNQNERYVTGWNKIFIFSSYQVKQNKTTKSQNFLISEKEVKENRL